MEIESLRRQLAGSQASTTDRDSKEELEAQHAKQQIEIESLRQELQERGDGCTLERDQQLEHLRGEITQLQEALATANAAAAVPSRQTSAQASKQVTTSQGTGAMDGDREQKAQLNVVSCSDWSLNSEAEQWCQMALQDRPTFCSQLGRLQQELEQQRADLATQKATAAQQRATISQQADRLAQAATDLTDKADALQRCSAEVAELQCQLTDCRSVTGLQSDQLAVLQAEVDQLRASLAAAEKLAGGTEAAEQLQQEVEELKGKLHVSLLVITI